MSFLVDQDKYHYVKFHWSSGAQVQIGAPDFYPTCDNISIRRMTYQKWKTFFHLLHTKKLLATII